MGPKIPQGCGEKKLEEERKTKDASETKLARYIFIEIYYLLENSNNNKRGYFVSGVDIKLQLLFKVCFYYD